ncbi:hypothetical protein Emag_005806 [Eimeria magna]
MEGRGEDSRAVEEIWDERSSPFAKLERQWDDIYLAEFLEVTAAPRRGTPSWTTFLTASLRQFIARPSARALGGLLAPRPRHDEEGSDEAIEARPALPTPASSGASAELEGSAELLLRLHQQRRHQGDPSDKVPCRRYPQPQLQQQTP